MIGLISHQLSIIFFITENQNIDWCTYLTCLKIKELLDGNVVGSGSDYLVIQKEKKRYYVEILPLTLKELKNSSTPYGSQID